MSTKTRMQQIEEMLRDEPNDPFLRYGLAMEHASQGNDAQAAEALIDLAQIAPDYVPAYVQAGQALLRLQRLPEARAIWTRGIAAARKCGDAHAAEEMQGFVANLEEV